MIKTFFSIAILLLNLPCACQEEREPFFNEINISINRTYLKNENTVDKFGAGLGIYKIAGRNTKLRFVFGFEYNYTRQMKKEVYETHFSYSENVLYSIGNISIPFALRAYLIPKLKLFAEASLFFDLLTGCKRRGTMHSFIPDQNNNIVHKELKFTEKLNLIPINFGFSPSVGYQIPVLEKKFLLIKAECNWGLLSLSSTYTGQDSIFNKYFRVNFGLHF